MIKSKRSHEGYLLIDHRNAPGAGQVAAGATFESATITCSHCQSIVVLNPNRTRERHHCAGCDHYICDGCALIKASGAPCKTMNQVLDELQAAAVKEVNGSLVIAQE